MIKKIIVEIDKKQIELTKDQAVELKNDLNEIFKDQDKITFPVYPFYPVYPDPVPYTPNKFWYDDGTTTGRIEWQ